MSENNAKEHRSSTHADGQEHSEEARNLLEEPDQRRDGAYLPRNENIRLIILGLGMLLLLVGFVLFLFSGTVLPLFGTIVVVFLGYRRIDAWLDTADRSRY